MKRQLFITAIGAAALAGCGGHSMVPGPGARSVGGGGGAVYSPTSALTLVPAIPDPIPSNVLTQPLLGEARRFVGPTAPQGWLFMDGQALRVDQYPSLFAMLGHPQGDKAKDTFILQNPGHSVIIAVSGSTPTSPQAYASMRDLSYQTSLGPHAIAAPIRAPKPEPEGIHEARVLLASAIAARSAPPENLSPEVSASMDRARSDAYGQASNALSARAASIVRDAVAAAVDGRTTVYGAISTVAGAIGTQDAWAALAINDRMQQEFSARPAGHRDPLREAATFLVTNAITPDQATTIAERA